VRHDATATGQGYLRYRRAELMLRFEGAYLAVTVALWHRHLERWGGTTETSTAEASHWMDRRSGDRHPGLLGPSRDGLVD
jgi:hypothetical protein